MNNRQARKDNPARGFRPGPRPVCLTLLPTDLRGRPRFHPLHNRIFDAGSSARHMRSSGNPTPLPLTRISPRRAGVRAFLHLEAPPAPATPRMHLLLRRATDPGVIITHTAGALPSPWTSIKIHFCGIPYNLSKRACRLDEDQHGCACE